ncbi:hypothetical protein MK851_11935 [Tenacibaculum sp. 1B UA]|uniref:hypothetical protein n=1 Tax=unclassified Tenacibaculum TaxID=2635139 RepID=UPI0026E270B7|nr:MULTISPECIES: hypothetical protein [unclassified Tenacibaculum]MDO6676435.1 hypothetical protein [Tenacibaculum sp. 1_MG-2023]MDX8554330.1 hypothetical protein [Tenacibaculum sp. 1B UA]
MKKLILAVAILAGVSTYATVNNTISPITPIHTVVADGFQEISLDKLPAALVNSIKESFPKATVNKAFVNEKEQYKLEISAEKVSKTIYTDKEGNLLEEKEVNNTKK